MKTLGTSTTPSSTLRRLGIVLVSALCTIVLAVLVFGLFTPQHRTYHAPYGTVAVGQSDWLRELTIRLNQKSGYDDQLQILVAATCEASASGSDDGNIPKPSELESYVTQAEIQWGDHPFGRDYRAAVLATCGYDTGEVDVEDD